MEKFRYPHRWNSDTKMIEVSALSGEWHCYKDIDITGEAICDIISVTMSTLLSNVSVDYSAPPHSPFFEPTSVKPPISIPIEGKNPEKNSLGFRQNKSYGIVNHHLHFYMNCVHFFLKVYLF